jgi:hypothetical protein
MRDIRFFLLEVSYMLICQALSSSAEHVGFVWREIDGNIRLSGMAMWQELGLDLSDKVLSPG